MLLLKQAVRRRQKSKARALLATTAPRPIAHMGRLRGTATSLGTDASKSAQSRFTRFSFARSACRYRQRE